MRGVSWSGAVGFAGLRGRTPGATESVGAPSSALAHGTPANTPGLNIPYTILPMGPAAGEDRAAAHSL